MLIGEAHAQLVEFRARSVGASPIPNRVTGNNHLRTSCINTERLRHGLKLSLERIPPRSHIRDFELQPVNKTPSPFNPRYRTIKARQKVHILLAELGTTPLRRSQLGLI